MTDRFPSPPDGQAPGQEPGSVYPEESQAMLAVIVSLFGVTLVPPVAPIAWIIASKELQSIRRGRRDPAKRQQAIAARAIGIVGTAWIPVVTAAIVSCSTGNACFYG